MFGGGLVGPGDHLVMKIDKVGFPVSMAVDKGNLFHVAYYLMVLVQCQEVFHPAIRFLPRNTCIDPKAGHGPAW